MTMAENISDRNGRALEFAIVRVLVNKIPNIKLLGGTLVDQQRDSAKFSALSEQQQAHFINSAEAVFTWLTKKQLPLNLGNNSIERLTDDAAKKGDVTDIRLRIAGEVINLSVKHNHQALKHQRPTATAVQGGYAKNSPEDIAYRTAYKKITDDFLNSAEQLKKGATEFAELKAIQADFIDKQLYAPICKLVTQFLNSHTAKPATAQQFFSFIVGMTDYHKIIVYNEKIEIHEFALMPDVKSLMAFQVDNSYIHVRFSNSWTVSMRLHTASSRIKGVSLKFDTQLLNTNNPIELSPMEIITLY
jgi:hypothetical protein